jgi:hypothetical protein
MVLYLELLMLELLERKLHLRESVEQHRKKHMWA